MWKHYQSPSFPLALTECLWWIYLLQVPCVCTAQISEHYHRDPPQFLHSLDHYISTLHNELNIKTYYIVNPNCQVKWHAAVLQTSSRTKKFPQKYNNWSNLHLYHNFSYTTKQCLTGERKLHVKWKQPTNNWMSKHIYCSNSILIYNIWQLAHIFIKKTGSQQHNKERIFRCWEG